MCLAERWGEGLRGGAEGGVAQPDTSCDSHASSIGGHAPSLSAHFTPPSLSLTSQASIRRLPTDTFSSSSTTSLLVMTRCRLKQGQSRTSDSYSPPSPHTSSSNRSCSRRNVASNESNVLPNDGIIQASQGNSHVGGSTRARMPT